MITVSTIFHIRDGQITNKSVVRKMFEALQEGRYKLTVEKSNKRSLNQNDYYWMILTDYVQPALYSEGWREIKTKDDAHDFVRSLFLKVKIINEVTGDTIERIKSTTELTTVQFNEYLEEIWQWSSEYLSIAIPSPNEQLQFFNNEVH